jgi:hypothetical protein
MKKSRDASELAARITAAANKPAGASSILPTLVAPSIPTVAITPKAAPPLTRSKAKAAKAQQPDTVPITLRPTNALLNKFVLKASERTREEGRVVSAQQIMLEALERSDA